MGDAECSTFMPSHQFRANRNVRHKLKFQIPELFDTAFRSAPTCKKEIQQTASPQIGSAVVPVRRSLVSVGEAKNNCFTSRRASYLHPDWQTLARETTGDGDRGHAEQIEWPSVG